jgi:hypothetical protein
MLHSERPARSTVAIREVHDFGIGGAAESDRESGDLRTSAVAQSRKQAQLSEGCRTGIVHQLARQPAGCIYARLDNRHLVSKLAQGRRCSRACHTAAGDHGIELVH